MKSIFTILLGFILFSPGSFAQVQTACTYLNISEPGGGPVQNGDILEIRGIISVPSGTTVTGLTYTGTVPNLVAYQANSLKAETNEGVVIPAIPNTGNYTDAAGDDRGQKVGNAITINMGTGATSAAGGTLVGGTTTPIFFNSQSILMAAYRVKVTGVNGGTFIVNGVFQYTVGGVLTTKTLTSIVVGVYAKSTCTTPGLVNYMTSETNGTFGSGTTQNRTTSSANVTGFTFVNLSANQPSDGFYSIVKNNSPTQYTGATPAAGDRVFGVWDVIGDHTGSSNGTGNPPAANNVSAGYMLAINGTYAPSSFFKATANGLTTNTEYTVSFWVYNLCPLCGADPSRNASSGTPGVKPNVAFGLGAVDYYTTGELAYSGQWVQGTFTFNSGASTSFPINIRNNAPGGGGNDFAIDDISLTTCLVVLPLDLLSFTGSQEPGGVALNWQTSNEVNTAYFAVERNDGNNQFDSIGRVEALALASGSTYHFTDNSVPPVKEVFYRLRIVDIDGKVTYSPVISVQGAALPAQALGLAPNPAHNNVTLYLVADAPGTAEVSLYSMAGTRVLVQTNTVSKGQNALPIGSIDRLSKGIYVVRMVSGNQTACTKLVVE